jgi:nitrate/nitrite transporter NarK
VGSPLDAESHLVQDRRRRRFWCCLAGAFSAAVIGRVLDATGNNYTVVFFACASVYLIAVVIIHFILPRHRTDMVAEPLGAAVS